MTKYATSGSFGEIGMPNSFMAAPGHRFYKAVCGACGAWQSLAISIEMLEHAAFPVAGPTAFEWRGWSIQEGKIRCPCCTGRSVRPDWAPPPLPEPPVPVAASLTREEQP